MIVLMGGRRPCRSRDLINVILVLLVFVWESHEAEKDASCDSPNMINCLLSLVESTEKDGLYFPDTQEKLHRYCGHVMKGLHCANELLEKCASEGEKQMYRNLTRGMYSTNEALCTEGSPLSVKFLKHVGCFKKLSERFNPCSERYIGNIVVAERLSPEEHAKMTCCTLNEYNRCMKNVVTGRCDKEAADMVEGILSRTLSTPMEFCSQLEDVPKRDCRRKFTPLSSENTDNRSEDYDDNNSASAPGISLMLLTLVLIRLMLFR